MPFMAMSSHDRFVIKTPLRPGNVQRERNITFFFSGDWGFPDLDLWHYAGMDCDHPEGHTEVLKQMSKQE